MRRFVLACVCLLCLCVHGGEILAFDFAQDTLEGAWSNMRDYRLLKRVSQGAEGVTVDAISREDQADRYCGFEPLKVALPSEYSVEFESRFEEGRGDAHYGVKMNGAQIVLRKAFWSFGNVSHNQPGTLFQDGQKQRFIRYRMVNTPQKIVVFADGKAVLDITKKEPGKNSFGFYVYNVKATFRKVRLQTLGSQDLSANLVRNSSFESISGTLPEYWGTAWWGLIHEPWTSRPEEFRKHFAVDSTGAHSGRRCFRLELPAVADKRTFQLCSTYLYLKANKPYTVSAWMRASVEKLPVSFRMRTDKGGGVFLVGKEWKRYSFVLESARASSQILISPEVAGTVWVDDVQIEEGRGMSAYAPHLAELNKDLTATEPPSYVIPLAPRAPVVDGVLEPAAWSRAVEMPLAFRVDGLQPQRLTIARVMCDEKNLYVGVECPEPNMNSLRAKVTKHKGPVWDDDAVEIFLKPSADSSMYYQFAVNTLNTRYEGLTYADAVWRGTWDTAVKKLSDRWVVEAVIPLSNMTSMSADGTIGLMIGRDAPGIGEYTATASVRSFMNLRGYNTVTLSLPHRDQVTRSAEVSATVRPELVREFSVFTSEPSLRFRMLGGQELLPFKAELLKGGRQVAQVAATTTQFEFKNVYGVGDYAVKVTTAKGTELTDSFKVVEPTPYESKVNYWKRTLVSCGKDFYMFGISMEMRHISETMAKLLTDSGFNLVDFSGWYPKGSPYPEKNIRESFDNCHKYGAKVVNTFRTNDSPLEGIMLYHQRIGNHPAQLLAYMYDEWSFKGFTPKVYAEVDQAFKTLREKVGYGLASFQNEYDLGVMRDFNMRNADMVSLDHYPVPKRDIASTSIVLKKLMKTAGHRPVNLFTQLCGNAYFHPRLPNKQEVFNQYYQGMTLDCWNFIAFANIPVETELFEATKAIRRERDELLGYGVHGAPDAPVTCSTENIQYLARETDSGVVLISVNLVRKPVSASFSMKGMKRVQELFGTGEMRLDQKQLTVPFKPLERRVFRLER